MASGSTVAVYSAIIGNTIVMFTKLAAFLFSGSGAMLSEAIHSFADVSNQCLLALGIQKSKKKPDDNHPYGYSRERFIWTLISAIGIFFVGCGVTVYHGIIVTVNPKPITDYTFSFAVLFIALIVEGIVLYIAVKQIQKEAKLKGQTFFSYLNHNPDPMGLAVILEDSVAIIGVLVAAAGIGLSWATGNYIWDGIATLTIGILLGGVAITLIYKTKSLLLGKAISSEDKQKILQVLQKNKSVGKIYDVKTMILGPEDIRVKAEIDFNGKELSKILTSKLNLSDDLKKITSEENLKEYLENFGESIVDSLGLKIDQIEKEIRKIYPEAKHIDLESH